MRITSKLKEMFTKWYIKRGYTFEYDFSNIDNYVDYIATPDNLPQAVWHCPYWVRPLLIMFSPSIYYIETFGKNITEGLYRGLTKDERFGGL